MGLHNLTSRFICPVLFKYIWEQQEYLLDHFYYFERH